MQLAENEQVQKYETIGIVKHCSRWTVLHIVKALQIPNLAIIKVFIQITSKSRSDSCGRVATANTKKLSLTTVLEEAEGICVLALLMLLKDQSINIQSYEGSSQGVA